MRQLAKASVGEQRRADPLAIAEQRGVALRELTVDARHIGGRRSSGAIPLLWKPRMVVNEIIFSHDSSPFCPRKKIEKIGLPSQ